MAKRRNAIPRNEREAQLLDQSLAALASMRRDGLSLDQTASSQGIDPKTVLRYVGSALRQEEKGGRYFAKPHDRIPRTVHAIVRGGGKTVVTVDDSRIASRIAEHLNAIRTFARRGDSSALESFKGESFEASQGTFYFETDLDALARLGDAGQLVVEGLYRVTHGG
jgi:hypothetical protein